jgi:hypothetical protein
LRSTLYIPPLLLVAVADSASAQFVLGGSWGAEKTMLAETRLNDVKQLFEVEQGLTAALKQRATA